MMIEKRILSKPKKGGGGHKQELEGTPPSRSDGTISKVGYSEAFVVIKHLAK